MSLTEESSMEAGMNSRLGISYGGSNGSLAASLESPAGMDLDMNGSGLPFGFPTSPISVAGASSNLNLSSNSWRHTPPPISSISSGRVGKRKFDDRYDPYPSAKRRAVSPAVSMSPHGHVHSYGSLASPIALPRSPILIPRPLPMSVTASPISRPVMRLSDRYGGGGGGNGGMGSGTGGGIGLFGMGPAGSWSTATGNVSKAEEKEVSGTGDGVGSLTLQ